MAAPRKYSRDFVNSIARALVVMRCFSDASPSLSLSDVAVQAKLTRASARRILLTLTELGYARFDGRLFSLTPRVLGLGYAYLSSMGFAEAVRPYVEQASRLGQESSSLSVLSGNEIVYVCRVHTERIMSISLGVGTHLPAHVTSMGRVLLAELPEEELRRRAAQIGFVRYTPRTITTPKRLLQALAQVRTQGHAIVEEELEAGLSSIAVPIRNSAGVCEAALNFGGPTARLQGTSLTRKYLPILKDVAQKISDALHHGPYVISHRSA